jgi:hypothetical protein
MNPTFGWQTVTGAGASSLEEVLPFSLERWIRVGALIRPLTTHGGHPNT